MFDEAIESLLENPEAVAATGLAMGGGFAASAAYQASKVRKDINRNLSETEYDAFLEDSLINEEDIFRPVGDTEYVMRLDRVENQDACDLWLIASDGTERTVLSAELDPKELSSIENLPEYGEDRPFVEDFRKAL